MADAALSGAAGEAGGAVAAPEAHPTAGQPGAPGAGQGPAGGGNDGGGARLGEAVETVDRRGQRRETTQRDGGAKQRPQLPGVVLTDAEGDDAVLLGKKPGKPGAGGRDAQGRFVAGAPSPAATQTTATGDAVSPDTPVLPEGEQPKKQRFAFAGGEFASQEHAEQTFRSLRGMFKPLKEVLGENPGEWATKVQELRGGAQVARERDSYRDAYVAWRQDASAKEARIAELENALRSGGAQAGQHRQVSPAAGAQPAAGQATDVESVLNGIDMDAYEAIAVQGGLPAAGRYLTQQILTAVTQQLLPAYKAEFEQKLRPFEDAAVGRQVAEQAVNVFQQVAELRDVATGEMQFPELQDEQTASEVARLWTQSGLPAEHAMTPQGVIQAVGLYRMLKPRPAAPPPALMSPPRQAVPTPGPAASVPPEAQTRVPSAGRSPFDPATTRLLRSLDSGVGIDRNLGFARRRA